MAFDLSAVSAYVNEHDNADDIFKRAMFGNDSAQWLTQISRVKKTNALPSANHEQDVLVSAESELTASDFDGDLAIAQTDLITTKVAYWNKFRIDDLEGYFTQVYLPRGASYGMGEAETVLGLLLQDDIPNVISKQVEKLTWQGDTALSAPNPLRFTNGFAKLTDSLTPTSSGVLSGTNTRGYIDGLIDTAVADADWDIMTPGATVVMCGYDAARYYDQEYRSNFGALPYNTEFEKRVIDGTNVMIIPVAGLTGTNEVYLVRPEIMVQGSDLESDQNNITMGMDQFEEYVWVKCKFRLGFACRDINSKSILVHRETPS